jgi:hypothetical protein
MRHKERRVMPQAITEKDGIHQQWYEDAKKQTGETVAEFIRHLSEDYQHDYGTICHAIAAGAIGAAWAIERSPSGGITGFQAGCIMWGFIQNWMTEYKESPVRLLNYRDLLYPQYAHKFRAIPTDTWEWAQKEAQKVLQDAPDYMHREVKAHLQSVADRVVPFGLVVEEN